MCAKRSKHFSREEKKMAIELWRAKMSLKAIRDKVKMSESTLRRIWPLNKIQTLWLLAARLAVEDPTS
jgi:hypothetical protein